MLDEDLEKLILLFINFIVVPHVLGENKVR